MDTLQLVDDDRVLVYTLKKGIQDTILYNEIAVRHVLDLGQNSFPTTKDSAVTHPITFLASKVSVKRAEVTSLATLVLLKPYTKNSKRMKNNF